MIDTDITREDFQLRLANAWALGVDQINISDATVQEVYKQAKRISGKYSSRIPIVQKETMKKKLPSMAAALAATQYNMSDDGKQLIVLPEHVIAVCMLLEEHYDSDACQYDMYSENEFTNSSLTDVTMVDAIFEEEAKVTGGKITHCIQHLLSQRDIDIDYLSDSFVYCELPMATRRVLKTFVVNRCLERKGRVYVKTKAFTQYLKDKKKQRKEA